MFRAQAQHPVGFLLGLVEFAELHVSFDEVAVEFEVVGHFFVEREGKGQCLFRSSAQQCFPGLQLLCLEVVRRLFQQGCEKFRGSGEQGGLGGVAIAFEQSAGEIATAHEVCRLVAESAFEQSDARIGGLRLRARLTRQERGHKRNQQCEAVHGNPPLPFPRSYFTGPPPGSPGSMCRRSRPLGQ